MIDDKQRRLELARDILKLHADADVAGHIDGMPKADRGELRRNVDWVQTYEQHEGRFPWFT